MMKNYILITLILFITLKINGQVTLTQTTTNTINVGTVACNQSAVTRDNTYYRAFDLNELGYTSIAVTNVEFGIQQVADESAGFSVDAVIYGTNSFPSGTLTEIATVAVPIVTADSNTLKSVPITANVVASSYPILVFAVKIPDENLQGHSTKFFLGANGDGQSKECYISSNSCSISQPMTLTAAGFPNTHNVMNVVGSPILGVEEVSLAHKKIKIHPNPTSNFISVSGIKKQEEYTIYNSIGAKIISGSIKNNEIINVQNINQGIYIFKFKNGNALKFIKE